MGKRERLEKEREREREKAMTVTDKLFPKQHLTLLMELLKQFHKDFDYSMT